MPEAMQFSGKFCKLKKKSLNFNLKNALSKQDTGFLQHKCLIKGSFPYYMNSFVISVRKMNNSMKKKTVTAKSQPPKVANVSNYTHD